MGIEDRNLFMMCSRLNGKALRDLPYGYTVRNCRKEEFSVWCRFPFDSRKDQIQYCSYMEQYFQNVYAPKGERFWECCLFVCDEKDVPVATGFLWEAYENVTTLHWLKVKKEYEGKGIGRGLLTCLLGNLSEDRFPVFLHTQPGSFRAIKLYSDFGFSLLTDLWIGNRKNELDMALPFLKEKMTPGAYQGLSFASAPESFLLAARSCPLDPF